MIILPSEDCINDHLLSNKKSTLEGGLLTIFLFQRDHIPNHWFNELEHCIFLARIGIARYISVSTRVSITWITINGNTIDINTANPTRIVVNADTIDLATTGVAPGSYTKVEVDGYGRVTGGVTPTKIADLGIQNVYTKAEVDAITQDLKNQIAELHLYIMSRI